VSNTTSNQHEASGTAQEMELSEIQAQIPVGPNLLGGNLGLLNGLKVTLTVVVGDVTTTLGELLSLKESAVLKIDRQVDYPVDVMVNGSVVARGQLVVVDDNFGVRVTEIATVAQS
jgi:flagellar motor switch protein FliN/FliY